MENVTETYKRSEETNNANETSHYSLLAIGIVIGFVGVILRFLTTWTFIDILSNIILIIGIVICLKSVLNILK